MNVPASLMVSSLLEGEKHAVRIFLSNEFHKLLDIFLYYAHSSHRRDAAVRKKMSFAITIEHYNVNRLHSMVTSGRFNDRFVTTTQSYGSYPPPPPDRLPQPLPRSFATLLLKQDAILPVQSILRTKRWNLKDFEQSTFAVQIQ